MKFNPSSADCAEKSPSLATNPSHTAAVMFGSIAKGTTQIAGFLQGADCLSTISCFRKHGRGHRKS